MALSATFGSSKVSNAWKIFAIILFVNIMQAIFSPLLWDEPYYWVWAKDLSWGYFDHPPMIALLIRMGTVILPGELGVRIFSLILGSLTYFFICRIIEEETGKPVDFKLAALMLFSSLFLNLYTFLACPDTPLLFFAALFLYTYRRYLQNDNLLNTLLIGVVTALLLYAKYQGVLLIFFTVLSNLKLLGRRSFYLVILITVVLFIPHIQWQIQNDYPTIRFHLFEREKLESWHDYNYLPKQLLFTGPVILLLFSILYRTQNKLQRALKFNVIGIFGFFFLSSFHELVNMHWTSIAWPPMLCLAYFYIDNLKKYRLYINLILIANLLAIVVLRINFITNTFKVLVYNDENPQLMSSIITSKSQGHPVVFLNMYNEPSFYMFYSHQNDFAINNVLYKKTQFNYTAGLEKAVQGKTVSLISDSSVNKSSEKISIPKGKQYYLTFIPNFSSFNTSIKLDANNLKSLKAATANTVSLTVEDKLDSAGAKLLKLKGGYLQLNLISKKDGKLYSYKYDKPLNLSDKGTIDFTFVAPADKENYRCIFSIMTSDSILGGFNSNIYTVKVQ